MEKLKELFYDEKKGLIGLKGFYNLVKEEGINLSYNEIKNWYDKQEVNQLLKQPKKPKEFSSVIANYPRDQYQMDIIVYDRFEINHYKYILVVIDVYSRYLNCRALTTRRADVVLKNIKDIFQEMGIPMRIQCDREFTFKEFEKYCIDEDIKVTYSDPGEINKNSIVERVNKSIALMLQRHRVGTGNKRWFSYLNNIVYKYNNSIHTTIKNKPVDVFQHRAYNEQEIKVVVPMYDIGDKVRRKEKKTVFSKGDVIQYSSQIYLIKGKRGNRFELSDGSVVKPYEIRKVNEVQYKDDDGNKKDILQDIKVKQNEKKIKNNLKKDGIDQTNIIKYNLRSRERNVR